LKGFSARTESGTRYSEYGGLALGRICRSVNQVDWIKCIPCRLLSAVRRENGLTLIEVVVAIALFGIVTTSLIGVLSSATAADGRSREKTIALELAQQEIEYVRQLNYRDVGLAGGNPGGVVQGVQSKKVTGLWYTLTTTIKFVNDPTPGSSVTAANYKRIQVQVSRSSDGYVLATAGTYISSPTPLETGGLNNGLINVTVEDFGPAHQLLGNAHVGLIKTWDGSFSAGDYTGTDSTSPSYGVATFEGLEPTPTSPDPLGYYDITVTLDGYTTLSTDLPPTDHSASQSAGHVGLLKSGTTNTTIYLYKPSGITVDVMDGDTNNLYTGGQTTVTISSQKLGVSQQFTTTNGTVVLQPGDTLGGWPIAPSSDYQVDAATTTPYPRHGLVTGITVPPDYPNDPLNSVIQVPLPAYVPPSTATVTVEVRGTTMYRSCTSSPQGSLQSGATVKMVLSSNPNQTYSPSSQGGGTYTFTGIPLDTYNITASLKKYSNTYKGTLPNQVISGDTSGLCVSIY
jgi:prepilin-type N-terminal cleavage/methylation domain-containing protein